MLRDSMCEMNRSDIACCLCSTCTILSLRISRIALGVIAVALPMLLAFAILIAVAVSDPGAFESDTGV